MIHSKTVPKINRPMKFIPEIPASRKAMALISLVFTFFVVLSLTNDIRRTREHMLDKALLEARTVLDLNLAYRKWVSGHGGVYVPVTAEFRPNPYLSMHPKRDIVSRSGDRYTLVNPAMISRQVNEILSSSAELPIIIKVTSLKSINVSNEPDSWEYKALRSFDQGRAEVNEMAALRDQPYMRLIKPFIVDEGCLSCHAAQGYRLGDVRGGLSIAIPMKTYLTDASEERERAVFSHLFIWLIGMTGIGGLGVVIRKAEGNYIREKEFTETAVNTMRGTFFVLDVHGRYVRWNKAVEEACGVPAAAMRGREFLSTVHPDDRSAMAAALQTVMEQGSAETEARRLWSGNAEPRHYLFSARRMVVEGASYIVGSGVDITDRRLMENKLRTASAEWTTTFDAIHDCIMILDREYHILLCNSATSRLLGLPVDRIIGRRCWELMHDNRCPEACPVTGILEGKARETAILEIRGKICLITADPILDGTGGIDKIVHTISDITEQRRLESELHQAQKMEAIGSMAGGISHDFNNILSAIIGFASILRKKMDMGDPLRQYVEPILASAERATALTRTLLSFSRKDKAELTPVNINDLIFGFQKILGRLIGEDIEFTVRGCSDILTVEADKGQLEQVLMNLVTNARDAMPKGGKLALSMDKIVFDRDHGDLRQGSYASLSVSDSGSGMDKVTQEHIFEPFYTTKDVGQGTGLGLAIVYGIIKKHGGSIHVYSEKEVGTTFKIFLPLSRAVPAIQEEIGDRLPLASGTETILLAEDDGAARSVAKVLLEEFGYTVLEAVDGEAALTTFMLNRDRIDLILTDLVMPKMNGREVYEEVRKIRPGVKAVFMSGYTSDIISRKGLLEEGMIFISKPLTPTELLGKIQEALHQRS